MSTSFEDSDRAPTLTEADHTLHSLPELRIVARRITLDLMATRRSAAWLNALLAIEQGLERASRCATELRRAAAEGPIDPNTLRVFDRLLEATLIARAPLVRLLLSHDTGTVELAKETAARTLFVESEIAQALRVARAAT
ncbi:MAG: hypothetical protein U1E65_05570 [Myxococcota bacterium]